MKNIKRITALILSLVFLVASQSVFTVSAADPKLTSRKDFLWGVGMHGPAWSATYSTGNLETQLHQAAELGCKIIRTDASNNVGHLDKTVQLANEYGMKVMIIVYIPNRTFDDNYDLTKIEETFRIYAKRYDGKSGHGKVDYIQIDNELDNKLIGYSSGLGMNPGPATEIDNFDRTALENMAAQVEAAIKGVRNSGTDAKTVINMAWVHYGMLKYFQERGIEWDITGHDWYEDMWGYRGDPNEHYASGAELYDLFKKPIIICETNMWQNNFNGPTTGAPEDEYDYWDPLIETMQDYYEKDYVIGVCLYELWDELDHQSGSDWLGEAHFGLAKVNSNGTFKSFKPVYERLMNVFGGGSVKQLDWEKVEAKYSDEEDEDLVVPDYTVDTSRPSTTVTSSVVQVIGGSGSVTSGTSSDTSSGTTSQGTTSTEITYGENTEYDTDGTDSVFTAPVIICIAAAGVLALAAVGVGIFFLVRKPKEKSDEEIPDETEVTE